MSRVRENRMPGSTGGGWNGTPQRHRASPRPNQPHASRRDWDAIGKQLRPTYTAPTAAAAADRFDEFAENWGPASATAAPPKSRHQARSADTADTTHRSDLTRQRRRVRVRSGLGTWASGCHSRGCQRAVELLPHG